MSTYNGRAPAVPPPCPAPRLPPPCRAVLYCTVVSREWQQQRGMARAPTAEGAKCRGGEGRGGRPHTRH